MKYFEFVNKTYYALIVVDEVDLNEALQKAKKIYAELLEKEGIENVNIMDQPNVLIRIEALAKYLEALADMASPDSKIFSLVQEYDAYKDAPALVCRYKTGKELN